MHEGEIKLAVFPLVSICIPAYNSSQFIIQTIESLISQTYRNIEIVVVDDGSKDNTVALLSSIKDTRVKVYSQTNKGAAAARNKAYGLSNGSYIKFLDADDLINSICIEQQLQAIIYKPNSVATAKWGRFFTNDLSDFQFSPEHVWKNMPGIDWLIDSLVENGSNMTQPGIFLIPKDLLEKTGLWNESLSLIDDFEFMTRVLAESKEVIFCEEPILYYRGGMEESLSMQRSRKDLESALNAQLIGTKIILDKKNTAKSRLACANSLQLWAHAFYPKQLDLFETVNEEIKRLGGSSVKMDGGKLFIFLRSLLGWKWAKRVKEVIAPYRKSDIGNPKFLIPKKSTIKS